MTEEKRRYKTTIAGRNYTILAKKPEEHLRTVSEIVNSKINQIKEAMPALDIEQRSVLVTINSISEAIEKQEELHHLKETIADLEKANDRQQRKIDKLESRYEKDSLDLISSEPVQREREDSGHSLPAKQRKAESKFVRPTTISGMVLQRANMDETKKNKEIPPYSKKRKESQINQSNRSLEDR